MIELLWNPWSLFGFASGIACLALGIIVLRAHPNRRQNQLLAIILFTFAGLRILHTGFGALLADLDDVIVWQLNHQWLFFVQFWAYLLFFGTFDTPLAKPFRSRIGIALVSVWTLALFVLIYFEIGFQWLALAGAREGNAVGGIGADGPVFHVYFNYVFLLWIYGLAVAVSAMRRAKTRATRNQMKWVVAGFGINDMLYLLFMLIFYWVGYFQGALHPTIGQYLVYSEPVIATVTLLFVSLLTYGILRDQIFDIDLKIKFALKQGTVAAAFLVVFFVASQLAALALVNRTGAVSIGVGAAALLLVVHQPIQRAAGIVVDRLMPGVTSAEGVMLQRKLEVYRAALDDPSMQGGDRLKRLRDDLGLTVEHHEAMVLAMVASRAGSKDPFLERYEVRRELGRGASGRAVLATDLVLGRDVVLKQPLAHMLSDEAQREAFLEEARLAARLSHPNVLVVHEVHSTADPPVIVWEHGPGGSLDQLLARQGRLQWAVGVHLGKAILAGLQAIHHAGIVHGDLKPGNVILDGQGRPKIGDFGIARRLRPDPEATVTAPDLYTGSYATMSPEQARGDETDARSDLYSMAALMHMMVAGRPYIDLSGVGDFEARQRIMTSEPRLPLEGVPASLSDWIAKGLAKDPAKRFASAGDMADALRAIERDEGGITTPRRAPEPGPKGPVGLGLGSPDA